MIFPHTFDHYKIEKGPSVSGGGPTFVATLLEADVVCFFQDAPSENKGPELKITGGEQKQATVFMLDGPTWEDIAIDHRIRFEGVLYCVKGKKDLCHLGRVFRLDVVRDISQSVTGV